MARILLITNVPTPYRLPLFNELARQLSERGIVLKVIFGASGYARREWEIDWKSANFEYEVLAGKVFNLGSHERYMFTYPGLLRLVRREQAALVITAGFSIATMLLRISRLWTGIPFVIWSEENKRRSSLREAYRRWLVKGAAGFIACGSASKRYLQSLGVRTERIWIAINTVDTEFFGAIFKQRRRQREHVSRHILLSVSALIPRKQLETVLRATACLSNRRSDFEVWIVGSGPERGNLEKLAEALGIAKLVTFTGYLQRAEVAEAMGRASCFLFPSWHDVWGMVLVEAMATGLPCISSVRAGATCDLIEDGVNGYAVDFTDTVAVINRIEMLVDDPDHARSIGTAAHKLVESRASLTAATQGFVEAVQALQIGEGREP